MGWVRTFCAPTRRVATSAAKRASRSVLTVGGNSRVYSSSARAPCAWAVACATSAMRRSIRSARPRKGAHGAAELHAVGQDVARVIAARWRTLSTAPPWAAHRAAHVVQGRERARWPARHRPPGGGRAVAPLPKMRSVNCRPGQAGAGRHGDGAHRQHRRVVRATAGRKALEQTVGDHGLRAAAAFLGGLEDQVDGAVEAARLRQVARRAQQHGGMAVMTAGVHHAGAARGVGEGVELAQGERIHVRAQAPAAPAVGALALDHADDAGASDAPVERYAQHTQFGGDAVGGAVFLEAQLGPGVESRRSAVRCSCAALSRRAASTGWAVAVGMDAPFRKINFQFFRISRLFEKGFSSMDKKATAGQWLGLARGGPQGEPPICCSRWR